MTRTTTTRLGISKPTPGTGEGVDPAIDVGTNWDKVDAAVGCTECTESTKPATPWDGQFIRTTDTRRVYVWNTTQDEWEYIGGGVGQELLVLKTTNYDHPASNTTLADVSEMQFSALANVKYIFELELFVTGSINGDIKVGFSFPVGGGGATITWTAIGSDLAATTQTAAMHGAGHFERTVVDDVLAFNAHGSGAIIRISGYITMGSTAGTVKLRAAQNTSNATQTSIRIGSWLKYTRASS